MAQAPLLKLAPEEVRYLKDHIWHDILRDKHLKNIFIDGRNAYVMREWLINRVLMTADHFKIRYLKEPVAAE